MDDEVTGGLPRNDGSQETLRAKMSRAVTEMNRIVERLHVTDGEPPLSLGEMGATVENTAKNSDPNSFAFLGSLDNGFIDEFYGPTAVIKDFTVPEKPHTIGFDDAVATAWEAAMLEEGVRHFATTAVKTSAARSFWERRGYAPVRVRPDGTPYAMVMTVKPAAGMPTSPASK